MTTRRVKDGNRRTQNGWASAPEFDDLRGLNGSAVAFKAALVEDPEKRTLLYFLQGLSLKEGGIKRIARELMEMFPERIGTPTMVKIGCAPGKRLSQEERDTIDLELHGSDTIWEFLDEGRKPDRAPCKTQSDEFYEQCRESVEARLAPFIERLCCDPNLAVTAEPSERLQYRGVVRIVLEDAGREEEAKGEVEMADLPRFHDVLGALLEFQKRYQENVRAEFVETSIGTVVFEALNYVVETGRSALVEGNSGVGKSTALSAWCEMNLGRARHIQLKGITNRTGFFREVARALGLARGSSLSASKVQMRVEQFLQRTKIMLVIDEGQYLIEAGNRVNTPPELINWLMTACYNERVPFLISATSEFTARRAIVEKNTTWQSEQLRRRIRRFFELPGIPTEDDLSRVATKLLPGMAASVIEYVVSYSIVSKGFFQALTDAIEDAHLIAQRDGRTKIKFSDLKAAIQDWRSPSDAALQRVFKDEPKTHRRRSAEVISLDEPEHVGASEPDDLPSEDTCRAPGQNRIAFHEEQQKTKTSTPQIA